jgi:UDP-N-acetylglucosamine transferase subunit ALG13
LTVETFQQSAEFDACVQRADVVISHAGTLL